MFNFLKDSTVSIDAAHGAASLNAIAPKVTICYSEHWYVFVLPY